VIGLLGETLLGEGEDNEVMEKLRGWSVDRLKDEEAVRIFKEDIRFRNELVQHFNAVTAAKILIQLELVDVELSPVEEKYNFNSEINFNCDRNALIKTAE